jgi:formylmethanofuran dehydrogenase subunit E
LNYGKFGAVFYDMDSKRAVRVTERKDVRKTEQEDLAAAFRTLPDEELAQIEEVDVKLDTNDLPGKPEKIKECQKCGELIFDGKEVTVHGKILCQACAEGAYYKPKVKKAV